MLFQKQDVIKSGQREITDFIYLDREALKAYYSKLTGTSGLPVVDTISGGISFGGELETSRGYEVSEYFLFESIEGLLRKNYNVEVSIDKKTGKSIWIDGILTFMTISNKAILTASYDNRNIDFGDQLDIKFKPTSEEQTYYLSYKKEYLNFSIRNHEISDHFQKKVEMFCTISGLNRHIHTSSESKSSEDKIFLLSPIVILRKK